uniref:Beta glucosidase 8 n=1 Tax=Stevia rebaudiana TaxID=55670 RepID=A0A7H5QG22_STERE|nr:beta glucosidase 8 [Stevia rebaudiana]
MNLKLSTISVFFFLISAALTLLESSNNGDRVFIFEENEEPQIKRSDFPSGFLFGSATSAYQVEGAYLEDEKSLSNWDVFCHSVGCGVNGENGDIADDHYHVFLRDIELMHSLGLQAYRFSISWARILPRGRFGKVNSAGIMFYNKIIENLILKGIEPFVTIYHVDFPQELEDRYGSWLNPEMQEEFIYFAEICFKAFGDRVKYWITINEPKSVTDYAYEVGIIPPSRCSSPFGNCLDGNSDIEPIIAMHNMLLAHGKAAKIYHENFQPKQGGSIGLTVHSCMYEPLTDSELDQKAANRAFAFHSGWTLDTAIFGDYPEEVKEYLGTNLPSFSNDEKNILKNSIDFIGINHYSTTYVKDCTNSSCSATGNRAIRGFLETVGERDGVLIGELTAVDGSYVVPRGMEEIVNLIKIRYNNKPMFITENGYSSPDAHEQQVNELTNDVKRVEYHVKYLAYLAKSVRGGADVRGYFTWSFMDSYEWLKGYDVRFGLYYVDRQTLTRIPKLSARWYKNFLTNNSDLVEKKNIKKQFKSNFIRMSQCYQVIKSRCIQDLIQQMNMFIIQECSNGLYLIGLVCKYIQILNCLFYGQIKH